MAHHWGWDSSGAPRDSVWESNKATFSFKKWNIYGLGDEIMIHLEPVW